MLDITLSVLEEQQAENVININLEGKSTLADCMIVASGRNNRHVGAMADYLVEKYKAANFKDIRLEGQPMNDWVLIDAGDIIVHLFRPEVRDFYNLEKLWQAARQAE